MGAADHFGSDNLQGKPRVYNHRVGRDRSQTDSSYTSEIEGGEGLSHAPAGDEI